MPLQVAGVQLSDPLDTVIARLGPAIAVAPDLGGPSHVFAFPGATLAVTVADDLPAHPVVGIVADVSSPSTAGIVAFDGIDVGATPLDVLEAAWGPPDARATHPSDDFALRYLRCAGDDLVIVKFDTAIRDDPSAPVTFVLLAFADAPAGCPQI